MSTSSPHGLPARRWAEVALAFQVGGYVTVYEADAYLRLERGTTKKEVLAGHLAARPQKRGRKVRYLVAAEDCERLLGIRKTPGRTEWLARQPDHLLRHILAGIQGQVTPEIRAAAPGLCTAIDREAEEVRQELARRATVEVSPC